MVSKRKDNIRVVASPPSAPWRLFPLEILLLLAVLFFLSEARGTVASPLSDPVSVRPDTMDPDRFHQPWLDITAFDREREAAEKVAEEDHDFPAVDQPPHSQNAEAKITTLAGPPPTGSSIADFSMDKGLNSAESDETPQRNFASLVKPEQEIEKRRFFDSEQILLSLERLREENANKREVEIRFDPPPGLGSGAEAAVSRSEAIYRVEPRGGTFGQ